MSLNSHEWIFYRIKLKKLEISDKSIEKIYNLFIYIVVLTWANISEGKPKTWNLYIPNRLCRAFNSKIEQKLR